METFLAAGIIGVSLGTEYALLALGFTLIFGILGVVNFAHGGFYAMGGYAAYAAVSMLGLPYPAAVAVAVVATAAVGYAYELVVIERLVDDHLATMMLTLGLYLILSTGLLVTFGPESPKFTFPITGTIRGKGFYIPLENFVVLCVCLVAISVAYVVIYRTDFGRALRALADDRPVAAAQGIRARLLFPLAFGLATGLAGLTGALVTPILSLAPHVGDSVLATSFLIVILGGLGSIGGATAAAFIVGIVEAYSSVYLGGSKGALALFVLVLIILVVRPTGLAGRELRGA
jgi:branched-chain amino acid transport system permease protein